MTFNKAFMFLSLTGFSNLHLFYLSNMNFYSNITAVKNIDPRPNKCVI